MEAVILRGKGVVVIEPKFSRRGVPYYRGLEVACDLCGRGPLPVSPHVARRAGGPKLNKLGKVARGEVARQWFA